MIDTVCGSEWVCKYVWLCVVVSLNKVTSLFYKGFRHRRASLEFFSPHYTASFLHCKKMNTSRMHLVLFTALLRKPALQMLGDCLIQPVWILSSVSRSCLSLSTLVSLLYTIATNSLCPSWPKKRLNADRCILRCLLHSRQIEDGVKMELRGCRTGTTWLTDDFQPSLHLKLLIDWTHLCQVISDRKRREGWKKSWTVALEEELCKYV